MLFVIIMFFFPLVYIVALSSSFSPEKWKPQLLRLFLLFVFWGYLWEALLVRFVFGSEC